MTAFLLALALIMTPGVPLGQTVVGDPAALTPGVIHDPVACRQAADETYALYLPTAYKPDSAWPIIYVFDPAARGRVPLERMRAAAERYGYILVGSNNSRNFDIQAVMAAAEAMWTDTHARFRLDDRRAYTAGFSGGARVASALASVTGRFAGAIACGAGFAPRNRPKGPLPIVYYATAGTGDMNYIELKALEHRLNRCDITNRLRIFTGGHEWPPAEVFSDALAWLNLQAMKKGTLPRDESFLSTRYRQRLTEARRLESDGRLLDAWHEYRDLDRDFHGLLPDEETRTAVRRLESLPALKQAREDETRRLQEEETLFARFSDRFNDLRKDPPPAKRIDHELKWWRKETDRLRRMTAAGTPLPEREMAERAREYVWRRGYEESVQFFQAGDYAGAATTLEIACGVKSDAPVLTFNLAAAYSRLGRTERALDLLDKAVAQGFTNADHMENSESLAPLRDNPRFRTLLEKIRNTPSPGSPDRH